MDSIDFNSYLPEDKESEEVKKTEGYQNYKRKLDTAREQCKKIIEKNSAILNSNPSPKPDDKKFSNYLILHLFESKEIRLEGREKITREEEMERYVDATHKLQKIFYEIPEKKFYGNQKKKKLEDDFNWAIVLFYNELAICYSGLEDSSISLGYAERSKSLLMEIFPEIDSLIGVNSQVVELFTFALYNKGEAERLLHNNDLSLKTFKNIIDIYEKSEWKEAKPSDYSFALLRMALILIDQGRGKEAIDCLNKVKITDPSDYRIQECNLEKISAFIDQKEYAEAEKELERYKNKAECDLTFTSRSAILHKIRCLLEWHINFPSEFEKGKEKWKKEYENIPKIIKGDSEEKIGGILKECIDRNDGDNFKKACKYFSDFYEVKKTSELELWGYFLYLFYERMDKIDIQNSGNWEDIKKKLDTDYLKKVMNRINDIDYMKDFFYCYSKYLKGKKIDNDELIEHLYSRLKNYCEEKDQLKQLEKIGRNYNAFKESNKAEDNKDLNVAANFISKKFFQTIPSKNAPTRTYLSPNSIENTISRNFDEFADKIFRSLPSHVLPSNKNKINGILIVLRRWNSFTPGLSSPASPSKGGGYFLYFKGENKKSTGIVIDPGFDFVDNLFFEGFSIRDIDIVLITHAHPDHTDNFPKMLALFHEMNDRLKEKKEKKDNKGKIDKKHIKVILSQGVFDLFNKQMDLSKESLKDIYVVDTRPIKEEGLIKCYNDNIGNDEELKIEAFRTSHGDLTQWESIGFLFSIGKNESLRKIGFTSDALWTDKFWKNFKECDIVCAHLGSIVNILNNKKFCNTFCENFSKRDDDEYTCKKLNDCKSSNFSPVNVSADKLKKQTQDEKHLYLGGLSSFFAPLLENDSKLKLGIISEFGEELKGGIRMDLFHKFDDWFRDQNNNIRCLPGDIGLSVDIFSNDVFCQTCQRYVDRKKINPVPYEKEEAIFFVCDECKSVLSSYQIEEKLKNYYTGL